MNTHILRSMVKTVQLNDYQWRAIMPEITVMWADGNSEEEALNTWMKQYNQEMLYSIFEQILQQRPKQTTVEEVKPIERPEYIEFPYRGKVYRVHSTETPPKKHIVLPDGRILVVCRYDGRYPAILSDVRKSDSLSVSEVLKQLDGVLAQEVDKSPYSVAVFQFEGQKYGVTRNWNEYIKLPNQKLYEVYSSYEEQPVRIAEIKEVNPDNEGLERWGVAEAFPVEQEYIGMAEPPRDIRIRFTFEGEKFILSHEAYEKGQSILYIPDHGFYQIGGYLESMPVKLSGLKQINIEKEHIPIFENSLSVALRVKDAVDAD